MKSYRNNWVNYSKIVEIPSNMAVGAVSYALERAVGDRGNKVFELSNHLGNVLATVSDKKLGRVLDSTSFVAAYYEAQVQSAQDYYAFGWNIPSRKFNTGSYRFGFNSQEKSPEISSGHTTALFWEYESRIAKRWNIDPRPVTFLSPYTVMQGNPMVNTDIEGDTAIATSSRDAQLVADDLNRIYEKKYNFKDAFSITEYVTENKKGEPAILYALTTNPKFDWKKDRYTSAMFDLVAMDDYFVFDIIADDNRELMDGYGGGFTESSRKITLSEKLTEHNYGDKYTLTNNAAYWTLGGVFLHEALYHIHPIGLKDQKIDKATNSGVVLKGPNYMRVFYNSKTGKWHGAGSRQNYSASNPNIEQKLENLKNPKKAPKKQPMPNSFNDPRLWNGGGGSRGVRSTDENYIQGY